jgi:hypothetical protein
MKRIKIIFYKNKIKYLQNKRNKTKSLSDYIKISNIIFIYISKLYILTKNIQ